MDFDKLAEENQPVLTSTSFNTLKSLCKSKRTFRIGIIALSGAIIISSFTLFFEDQKTINKVLLSRASTLNKELIKSENKKDILEAEILLLNEEVKSLIKKQDQKKISKISKYLADNEVIGKGLEIILKDNASSFAPVQEESTIIHNTDLLKIVNFLWAQDANAISINNERIAPNSYISCAGATILVNKKRINAPFKIHAIGENLDKNNVKNSAIMLSLLLRGIEVEVRENQNIHIPPAKYTTFRE